MKEPNEHLEKLLEQLVDNSAGLIRADLKLRAASQPREKLPQTFDKKMAFTRRMERLVLLLLLACFVGCCVTLHLLFPHWVPEQWAAFTSFFKQL